ncbi:MAG TPA: hypothetical protein VIM73_15065, partial [Polyangiaceae bacterium]
MARQLSPEDTDPGALPVSFEEDVSFDPTPGYRQAQDSYRGSYERHGEQGFRNPTPSARARANTLPLPPPPPMSQRRQARVYSAAPREGFVREGELLAGRYVVERIVGRVGIGIALRVRHVDLGQRCLLKYLPAESCVLPETVARFLRGARLALQLSSEH